MAIGLSMSEIECILDAIAGDSTPSGKLLRHRLWDLRSKLLRKTMTQVEAPVSVERVMAQLRVVTD